MDLAAGFLPPPLVTDWIRRTRFKTELQSSNFALVTHSKVSMASPTGPTAVDKEQIFGMAEKEMEYRVELFNKLTHSCFNKCVDKRYKESELNMGENSCIDRCVSKYWHVTNLIGQLLGSGRPPM
ncbi:Mitochondrial import inner membrane translocase subunit TIM10, partial [Cucurbita argyrosperma subsp. argyrosperma]